MIPRHCGDVGIADVKFSLTESNLKKHFLHRKSYTRSKFYVVNNGEDWAVVQVEKKPTRNLFQTIDSVKVLSTPDRTRFVKEPDIDVLQIGHLLRVQSRHPQDLIIIQGRFDHISFIDVRLPVMIGLVDVVPPRPSKLQSFIKNMLGDEASMLNMVTHLIDIEEIAETATGKKLMLPCGSTYDDFIKKTKKQIFFLDKASKLSKADLSSIDLIGCSLSKRIYEEIYGQQPKLFNICPKESELAKKYDLPTISRCCKIKNDVEVDGNWISVPWGADICEVGEAIRIALSKY